MRSEPAPEMMRFTASLPVDKRLCLDDIDGSFAHVRALGRAKILTEDEVDELLATLASIRGEFEAGAFEFTDDDEDIHTAIERRATELAGTLGAKLHTGRSRNDQVATALRLYTAREISMVADAALQLCMTLGNRASEVGDLEIPGYTHLQRAQRIPLAFQLTAHGWSLMRDVDRLLDARKRVSVSPLGAGAVGGSTLLTDPIATAIDLGFKRAFVNPVDAVADRDFVAETLFAVALLGVHLSRLGEEIAIYSSSEFGYYVLDDAWTTGSSMLPQKKNPDVAELARGKSGRLIGHLAGFLATLKGLPFAYNRDLQEDKEPLFDAFAQIEMTLGALSGVVASMGFDSERMHEAASDPTLRAVELADWMVARGTPFREAHAKVAEFVRRSADAGTPLPEIVGEADELGTKAQVVFGPEPRISKMVIAEQLERFTAAIEFLRRRVTSLSDPAD
jgi:argininosuccinate lyase